MNAYDHDEKQGVSSTSQSSSIVLPLLPLTPSILSLSLRLSDSVRVFCLTKGWISLASEGNVDRTANARSKALLEHRWIVDPSQCCRSRREVCVKKRTQEQRGVTLSRQEIASQPVL